MKKLFICFLLLLLPFLSNAQYIVLSTCNEIPDASLRNACLKASLENLIIKEVFRNLEIINLQSGEPAVINAGINNNKNGFFALSSISTPNFGLAKAVNNVIRDIKPLPVYKDKSGPVEAKFQFDYRFELQGDTAIIVFQKANDLLLKRTLSKEEEEKERTFTEDSETAAVDAPEKDPTETKNDDVAFAVIENVPIFPGCEGLETNDEFKDCMSKKISSMVANNFNSSIADMLDLNGRQRISVQFKIDTYGFVTDIKARAPHPGLEGEAIRVIDLLPRFTPGKQRGEAVNVLYSLPILFQVEGTKKTKK